MGLICGAVIKNELHFSCINIQVPPLRAAALLWYVSYFFFNLFFFPPRLLNIWHDIS